MKTAPKILLVFVRNPDFTCPKVCLLVQLSVPHISAVILVHLGKFYFTVSIHLSVRRPGPSSNFLPLEVLPTVLRLTPVCRAKQHNTAKKQVCTQLHHQLSTLPAYYYIWQPNRLFNHLAGFNLWASYKPACSLPSLLDLPA
jgi:hypothetical protein